MIDPQVAVDKLRGLETADEIASFLQEQEIRGIPTSSDFCAISRYMKVLTGFNATTGMYNGVLRGHPEQFNWSNNTPALREFISKFDHGHYPELIIGEFKLPGE